MRIEALFEPVVQLLNHRRHWLEDESLPVAITGHIFHHLATEPQELNPAVQNPAPPARRSRAAPA